MPKKKGPKGTKITLKIAKKAIKITPEGRRRLTLSNMGIRIFPKCLFKVPNLDELDLSRNFLQTLPDNFGNLTSLRWLDLHGNKLESVPESIGNLVGLTYLNLANNNLNSLGLPSSLGSLTNLQSLNLGMNLLDTLPHTLEHLDSLQELGLFDNLFMKLPEFVNVLHNLTKVNLQRNPLMYAQGGGELKKKKESWQKDDVYLIHQSNLCGPCLQKCKAQRERHIKGAEAMVSSDALEEKKTKMYAGLMTPNSVAIVSQGMWRIKKGRIEAIHHMTK